MDNWNRRTKRFFVIPEYIRTIVANANKNYLKTEIERARPDTPTCDECKELCGLEGQKAAYWYRERWYCAVDMHMYDPEWKREIDLGSAEAHRKYLSQFHKISPDP